MQDESIFIQSVIKESNRLIAENGFYHIQLSQLINRVNGSRSKMFSYFGNQQGLLRLILEDALQRMNNVILNTLAKDLEFDHLLSEILSLRTLFVKTDRSLLTFINTRQPSKKILLLSKQIETYENAMLSRLICTYYNISEYTITNRGLTVDEVWILLFPFEYRNNLVRTIDL